MVDAGGRIKNTAIESMCKTLHSLTLSNPENKNLISGPKLCVIFTNLSKFTADSDDIGPPDAESENLYSDPHIFDSLVEKFRKQVAD